jgi:hypothetical protein
VGAARAAGQGPVLYMNLRPIYFLPFGLSLVSGSLDAVTLSQQSSAAFDSYIREQEPGTIANLNATKPWGYETDARRDLLRRGQVAIETFDGKPVVHVPDGLIHDWVAAAFAPGISLARALQILEDYDKHKLYYGPEVMASRLLSKSGNQYRTYLRLLEKKVISIVLDTEYSVEVTQVTPKIALIRVRSDQIREVDRPGAKDEHIQPSGSGFGFLWRLNSYWRIEELDDGVYIECRAISLSRDVPAIVSSIVTPMVTTLPRESLEKTLRDTVKAAQRP